MAVYMSLGFLRPRLPPARAATEPRFPSCEAIADPTEELGCGGNRTTVAVSQLGRRRQTTMDTIAHAAVTSRTVHLRSTRTISKSNRVISLSSWRSVEGGVGGSAPEDSRKSE